MSEKMESFNWICMFREYRVVVYKKEIAKIGNGNKHLINQ